MHQHGSSLQNSEKVRLYVFSLRLNEQCQSLPCGLPAAACPLKYAFSSNIWRRVSPYVSSSIHDPAKLRRDAPSSRLVTLSRQVFTNELRMMLFRGSRLVSSESRATRTLPVV